MKSKILRFISLFKAEGVEKVFTEGMCYWFAYILKGRFPAGKIVYISGYGHFIFKYGSKYYDVTGDVTSKYEFFTKYDLKHLEEMDPIWYKRIQNQSILIIH